MGVTAETNAMILFFLILSIGTLSASQVFLGPIQGLLQLPTFLPSSCHLPVHPAGPGLNGAVAAMVNGYLHVCGGYDGGWSNLADCYALIESSWVKRESLKTVRNHAAGSLDHLGRLVVTGGENNFNDNLATTEVLEPTGVWVAGVSLPSPRREHCQVSTSMGILSIGGFDYDHRDLDSVLLLPPNGTEWVTLPPISKARSSHACTVHRTLLDDEVWVLGGFNEDYNWQEGEEGFLSTTEIFSLSTQTWRQGPKLPYGVNWGQAVVADGRLHHVGGIRSNGRVLKLIGPNPIGEDWEVVAMSGYDDVRDVGQAVTLQGEECP